VSQLLILHLLRVLRAAGERKGFRKHAPSFLALLGDRKDARWLEASRMGRDMFPEAELFRSPFPSEKSSTADERAKDENFENTV
jgi:hypothetical protein